MDEAEKYQQRLQAIAEKRRIQEEEEKTRRETEEEWLKLAQHKRKSLREQWLMNTTTPSSAEDPKPQSAISIPLTTAQSAKEKQSSERQMKKELEKSENREGKSSQLEENEPSVVSTDNTEAYLGEEGIKVIGVMLSKAPEEDTEEPIKAMTEEQEVNQLAVHALEPVDLHHNSLEQNTSKNEDHFTLADGNMDIIMAADTAEVEEEEWEMVNCSPEEGSDLTSDLTQAQTDSCLIHIAEGAVLKVEQVFILDEGEDLEIGASEVLNLVVAAKKSDLEDTVFKSGSERSSEESTPEGALGNICLEKGPDAGISELSNVSGIISEKPPLESKQNLPHLPAHTTQALEEILVDYTVDKEDHSIASNIVNVKWKEASGAEDEVCQYISLDRKREKSPILLKCENVSKSTEEEAEIQILLPSSATPKKTETKRKTCYCCIVM